jgi:hypothetical protein
MIRDGILTSERVNELSERAELFYRRLMSVVDDYGRYTANPTLLRSACYPLKVDSVKEDSIKKHLAEAAGAGLIVLYTVGGKEFLEIQDFGQRIQSKSKFPAPTDKPRESTVGHGGKRESTAVVGGVVGVEDVGDMAPPDKPAPPAEPPFIEIPVNSGEAFPVTEGQVAEFASLYPAVDVRQELRGMRAWAIANPAKRKTRGGMLRFVNSWLAKEQDKGGSRPPPRGDSQPRQRRQL